MARKDIETIDRQGQEIDLSIKTFPDRMKAGVSEHEILIAKRKQLAHEIQRKIDLVRQEMQAKQWHSSEVMTMTATLEGHWRDHAKMTEAATDYENRLRRLQLMVERKRKIASALKETEMRATAQVGIPYLDQIYGSAMAQNRFLAQGMREMQREVNILEAEQTQFLMELAD
jgi:hypothetical protein